MELVFPEFPTWEASHPVFRHFNDGTVEVLMIYKNKLGSGVRTVTGTPKKDQHYYEEVFT